MVKKLKLFKLLEIIIGLMCDLKKNIIDVWHFPNNKTLVVEHWKLN